MAVILEVKAGPFAGKRVAVMAGQTVTFGRAANRANFALPHDTFMSGLHFAVECGPNGCKLIDRKSSNGTFLNGARVTEVFLNTGDEVRSGQTVFTVRTVNDEPLQADAKPITPALTPPFAPAQTKPAPPLPARDDSKHKEPRAVPAGSPKPPIPASVTKAPPGKPALTIGGWNFAVVPEGWIAQGEFGIYSSVQNGFPSSAVVTQEPLSSPNLQDYVEAQLAMLRQYLREPQVEAVLPPKIHGSEETVAIEVRYKTKDGQTIFYRRVYVRAGRVVGVLTFTTLESDVAQVTPEFNVISSGASFTPTPAASPRPKY